MIFLRNQKSLIMITRNKIMIRLIVIQGDLLNTISIVFNEGPVELLFKIPQLYCVTILHVAAWSSLTEF